VQTQGTSRPAWWSRKSVWLAVGLLLGLAGEQLLRVFPASAQIPDSEAQRNAMIAELRATNAKLDQLYELVASGQVRVRLAGQEENAPPPAGREK